MADRIIVDKSKVTDLFDAIRDKSGIAGEKTFEEMTEVVNNIKTESFTSLVRAYSYPIIPFYRTNKTSETIYSIAEPYSENYEYSPTATTVSTSRVSSNSCTNMSGIPLIHSVKLDGKTYYGYKNAHFYALCRNTTSATVNYNFRTCSIKMTKYEASSKSIVTKEYPITSQSNLSVTTGSYIALYLAVPKAADDIILAIETIY